MSGRDKRPHLNLIKMSGRDKRPHLTVMFKRSIVGSLNLRVFGFYSINFQERLINCGRRHQDKPHLIILLF
jgi:hypothetical protein